ncbi:MAG: mercury transporter MerT, partial [Alphaproteobacteria bacterium]
MTTARPLGAPGGSAARARLKAAAAGGILGALAASSCCLLPLVLTVAGVSGAWMANLRALAPYQPVFIGVTAVLLGYGFYLAYGKGGRECGDADACRSPFLPQTAIRAMLWCAAALVLLAASFSAWFPLILPYLP